MFALGQDARDLLSQGIQAYKNSRYGEAVQLFERAAASSPDEATGTTVHMYLATALMAQYVPGAKSPENTAFAERAEAEFQEVLRREPNDKVALASMASLRYQEAQDAADFPEKERRLDDAASWYLRLLGVDPNNKEAYYSLGVIDWVKWYHADMEARASMGMKPEQAGPLPITAVRRELDERYSGMIEDGIANLKKALQIDPHFSDAMAYMNLLIRERGDLRETPEEYRSDVALADEWVHKALDTKRVQGQASTQAYTTPQRIRVGGNVQKFNLIHEVPPVYPPLAKAARIQGSVQFTAIIGKDGQVRNLQLISGHPLLVEAARTAVEQWQYKPTLLNGQPVEVVTQVDVNFTLEP